MKRVTIIAGHYGSGKTNIAVNYALSVSKSGKKVSLSDLDIVNPYFRSKDSEQVLSEAGIKLISSSYANSNVDVPALPAEAYSVTADKDSFAVIDVGGDDRGALALGRYAPSILSENNYEMLFVINKYRPLTSTPLATVEIMREIESAAGICFTAIINNSNIGSQTDARAVLDSVEYASEVSRLTGLPIKFTSVKDSLAKSLENAIPQIFPIRLYIHQSFSQF